MNNTETRARAMFNRSFRCCGDPGDWIIVHYVQSFGHAGPLQQTARCEVRERTGPEYLDDKTGARCAPQSVLTISGGGG
jgi:hypothetical protein